MLRIPTFTWRRPVGRFGKPQQILFWRAERTCGRVQEALRSECAVSALGRRPRGLRLAEEVQQLPLSELSEGCVGTLRSQRRIASEAALALGAGPELEQQPKLILPINGDAARGINLPDLAVYYDGASCHQAERLRGREYNPESLSEAENLQPQLVIRAPVTASFTAIARVRHHRREIARYRSNSAGARTSPRQLLRPVLAKNVENIGSTARDLHFGQAGRRLCSLIDCSTLKRFRHLVQRYS